MKKIYLLSFALLASFSLLAQDLLISGVFDGPLPGGTPKGIEIYVINNIADLSIYGVGSANNGGGSDGEEFTFPAVAATAGSFLYVTNDSTEFYNYYAVEPNFESGSMSINGDDAIELFMSGVVVDVFGDINVDGTGEPWDYLDGWAYRVNGTGPDGSAFALPNWTFSGTNTTDGCTTNAACASIFPIGTFQFTLLPEISFKTDSFMFNEGDGAIHLDTLLISPAIGTPSGEYFEIHLDAASTASTSDFNVNVGVPITFPYTYTFGAIFPPTFTAQPLDATLVDDALVEGSEWFKIILRNDGMNGLNIGADSTLYVMISDNDFPADTFVELTTNAITVNEGVGSFDINLDYQQTATNTNHTVELALVSGASADINNYTTMMATFNTLTEKFTVTVTEDMLVETDEVFTFALVNATNGLLIGSDSIFTLTIEDNDVPAFSLDLVEGNDATGADSAGVYGRFIGVVNSLDRGFNALEFSIQDANGSIDVYSNMAPTSNTVVAVGDEVEVQGTVTFFNGMVRIESLDSLNVLSTGNALTPAVVTEINDANESDLVRINMLTLVDPAQWAAAGGAGFDVQALDPAGDTVIIRIDRDYDDLYTSLPPNSGMIDVVGVASQYDETAPFDANHQIIPRDLNDIILYPTITMANPGTSVSEGAGTVVIDFTVANDNGMSYTVDVALTGGNGTADDIDNFVTQTGVVISGGTGSITVTITDDAEIEANEGFEFTISNPSAGLEIGNANKFDLTITDNDATAINEINVNDLKLYPNPAADMVTLDLVSNESQIATVNVYDVLGRTIISNTYVLNFGNNSIQMNLGDTAKGNYTLEVTTEAGSHSEKLMVK